MFFDVLADSFASINISEKGETEGDSYTPMLNDVIIVTPEFLGKKRQVNSPKSYIQFKVRIRYKLLGFSRLLLRASSTDHEDAFSTP